VSGRYAQSTKVSVSSSVQQIEGLLKKYGATSFAYGDDSDAGSAMVCFKLTDRQVRLTLPIPRLQEFRKTESRGIVRSDAEMRVQWEKSCRQRYRALLLIIKAKLVAIEDGITTLEREFLADIVTPSGETVSQVLAPQLRSMYERGQVPSLVAGSDMKAIGS